MMANSNNNALLLKVNINADLIESYMNLFDEEIKLLTVFDEESKIGEICVSNEIFEETMPSHERKLVRNQWQITSKRNLKAAPAQLPKKSRISLSAQTLMSQNTILSPKPDASSLMRTVTFSDSNQKEYMCTFCDYRYSQSGTVKRHIESKHLPQKISFNCLHCLSTFQSKGTLKKHYIQVHGLLEAAARAILP